MHRHHAFTVKFSVIKCMYNGLYTNKQVQKDYWVNSINIPYKNLHLVYSYKNILGFIQVLGIIKRMIIKC